MTEFIMTQSGQGVEGRAVIVATGASAKMLGLPSEARFLGRGVSTCATCDGFFFRGRDVFVIGGGDTAMEEALYLANIAASVTVVHRRHEFRASKVMAERVLQHPKVRVIWDSQVVEIVGDAKVSALRLRHEKTGEVTEHAADGVFIAIGHKPNTDLFKGQLAVNEDGYLIVDDRQRTNVEGVFAAGDVHDHVYRQAITAAGYGAMAGITAARWLQQAGDRSTSVPLALAS
ncbi:MAG: NAD(P)/FAD-dependent oxidoreductase [bacterium]